VAGYLQRSFIFLRLGKYVNLFRWKVRISGSFESSDFSFTLATYLHLSHLYSWDLSMITSCKKPLIALSN